MWLWFHGQETVRIDIEGELHRVVLTRIVQNNFRRVDLDRYAMLPYHVLDIHGADNDGLCTDACLNDGNNRVLCITKRPPNSNTDWSRYTDAGVTDRCPKNHKRVILC